jgi:peptide/nickel transport system substrate-binding protein
MKRLFWIFCISLGIWTVLIPVTGNAQPKNGGTLTIGLSADFDNVDPHKTIIAVQGQTLSLACENLVTSQKDFSPGPGLAESWTVSPDAKVWTFKLRKKVKFHNGKEMTAKDVKWNFDRMMDPKTGSGMRGRLLNVEAIEIVDSYTIRFRLKNPQSSFLTNFYGGSIQSPIVAPESVNPDGSITHPIGTGPFEFVNWEIHNYANFKKFKNYWMKGLPHVDRVIAKIITDPTASMTGLRTGEIDIVTMIPIEQVADVAGKPQKDFSVGLLKQAAGCYFNFNTAKPPFNDIRVRQAVAYGINKEEITKMVCRGYGQPVNQPFPKESFWYCDVPDRSQDIAKAKALLAEAGYAKGIEVTLVTNNRYTDHLLSAEALQAQLAEIGIKAKLDISDFATMIDRWRKGNFDMGSGSLAPVPDPDAYYPMALLKTGAYSAFSGYYDNPEVTKLLQEGSKIIKKEERKKVYTKAMKIVVDEVPYIYHTVPNMAYGVRARVKGFEPSFSFFFNYAGGGVQHLWLE